MKLIKTEFKAYKSISDDVLEIEGDITCLVGINEAGKSNVLFALEKVDREKKLNQDEISRHSPRYSDTNATPELKLWFVPVISEQKQLNELFGLTDVQIVVLAKDISGYRIEFPEIEYNKSKYFEPLPEPVPSMSASSPASAPSTPESTEQSADIQEDQKKVHADIETKTDEGKINDEQKKLIREKVTDDLINNFIPRFLRFDSVNFSEYFLPLDGEVPISEFIADPTKWKPVKNLLALGGITDLNKLKAGSGPERIRRDKILGDASLKINTEILRVVWPVESVEVHLDTEADILKIQLKEKGETSPFKPDERSRGLQWTLAFNIYFLAESNGFLKNSVLLIDEPGIFLHIDAQNKLLDQTFAQIVRNGNQIIYTTHLPYLIDSRYPERIRILEKLKENTKIGNKAWSQGEFGKIPEPVMTALGLKWTELLTLEEQNVITEGPSDQIILRALLAKYGTNSKVHPLPAYGYKKFPRVLAIIKVEDKHGFGLVDGDGDLADLREKCKMVSIDDDSLESIPTLIKDDKVITTEDVVPSSIFIDAIYHVYKPLCNKRKNCSLAKQEISSDYPRVKKMEEFFAKKFNARKHKLLKMELARAISERISILDITKQSSELNHAKSLVKKIEEKFPKEKDENAI